jgi:putative transposase
MGSALPETRSYVCCVADLYHRSRTHLSLGKDSPEPRSIQPEHMGRVVALPQVGGLHHCYERRAA